MPTVRKIDIEIEPDTYPAVERTMIDGIASGEIPPTLMQWTFRSELFLEIGPVEDASLIDRERAAHHGVDFGRRYNVSGGTGFFREDYTPVLYVFFEDRGKHTMTEYIDLAGEAMATALREVGIERATYRSGGDIELRPDEEGDQLLKVGVSGAGYRNGVWGVFANIINRSYTSKEFDVIDDVLELPKEKFEDKETDSAAGRMTSLTEIAPDVELDTIMAEATTQMAALAGDELRSGEFSDAERATIENHRTFYGSDEWFARYSTARILEDADPTDRVSEVAYKARKLIKLSVRVDTDDILADVQFTGDMFHRPGFEAIERINEAVSGVAITDDEALLTAIETVYETDGFEIPWLSPDDFAQPLYKARDSLVPADEFDRSPQ